MLVCSRYWINYSSQILRFQKVDRWGIEVGQPNFMGSLPLNLVVI